MKKYLSILAFCAALILSRCDGETKPDPNSPQYKAGYQEGYDEGMIAGEDNLCSRINSDNSKIHDWLKDHKICQ